MKIPDADAYRLLQKYNIPAVKWGIAKSLNELDLIIENTGLPVALKIDSPDIIHKLSAGCVAFVHNRDDLASAFKIVMGNAKKITKNINGVIVQEYVTGIESILGAKLDEQFGHVVMFGSGGTFTEILDDVSFRLVPITRRDALSMIEDTKLVKILEKKGISKDAIADVLVNVSKLAEKEAIAELDINPLFLSEARLVAADVRIVK
jgi:succinyl-CoA synthetase beta subunit